jgi:hypothetical protein
LSGWTKIYEFETVSMKEGEMDYKFVELNVEDTVAILGLARTESLNALSLEFAQDWISNCFCWVEV